MWHVPGELHNVSLRFMRHLMHLLLLLPPQPELGWKILYNTVLFIYILSIFRWRFAFNYEVIFDAVNDDVSRVLDLINFVALIVGHSVMATELLWWNLSDQRYCNIIYKIIAIRFSILFSITIFNCISTNTSLLLICHLYSELVFTLRCMEFSLHATLVLGFYKELNDVGNDIVMRLSNNLLASELNLQVQRLAVLQQLHQLLWKTHRDIEKNFERSLIMVMMKCFVDSSVMPYWLYLNSTRTNALAMQLYTATEEFGKLLEICIPCWICTRCDLLQRKFHSLFHGVSRNRLRYEINSALLKVSTQLSQEKSQFNIGGYLTLNNKMMGKFLFGMISYFIICMQFRIMFMGKSQAHGVINLALLCQNASLH
ncbi:putative gustatory receptor 98a [Drosophila nasuta]|uniref:putative gustatory receptor 98a n=1 Tax=Drosophila nasuta TaxID=42062 RepID=UPI00295EE4E1|nr:putative gustatory receptor 98a [Drosophila nasuta]